MAAKFKARAIFPTSAEKTLGKGDNSHFITTEAVKNIAIECLSL